VYEAAPAKPVQQNDWQKVKEKERPGEEKRK
jgi:hypothetical protein